MLSLFSQKKLIGFLIITAILIAIPLTVFIAQKQQEVRQRATGEEATVFFTNGSDQTPITQITLSPGQTATLALYVNSNTISLSSFDITVNLSNILSSITINNSNVVAGTDAGKFESLFTQNFDGTTGIIEFSKGTTNPSQNTSGVLHLLTIGFSVNSTAQGSGNIGVTKATLTSLQKSTALTVTMPTLSYTISTSSTVTASPGPTGSISGPGLGNVGQSLTFQASAQDGGGNLQSGEIWARNTYTTSPPASWGCAADKIHNEWCNIATVPLTGSSQAFQGVWTPSRGGTYFFVVNVFNSAGQKCSGNPDRSSDWLDCGYNDYLTTVISDTTPTPTPGPAGWWKFNENSGTIASDSSGSGLNGTLNGGPSWTSGRIAGGLSLSANQYVEIPNSADALHSNRQITIAGWFKLNNLNLEWSRIFWKGNPDCGTNCDNREYSLWVRNDGLLHLSSTPADRIGIGQVVCNSPTGTIQANQWYHFAAVLNSDANSMKSYINGVEKGSCSYSTSNIRTTNGNFQIGNALNGTVDDYRIYKRALSGAEITALYENITPTPTPTVSTTTIPTPTCTPPPSCLNAEPRCSLPVPPGGWCSAGSQLSLTVTLPGINGDVNSVLLRPRNPQKKFIVELFDSGNKALPPIISPLYLDRGDKDSATFVGNVDLGTSVPAGNYTIKIKTNKFLRKLIPGFKTITANTVITLPAITLINGDINNDNVMNIADYNILASCFGEKINSASCGNNKENADLNEDGKVDQVDYNIFLRNIQAKQGD